MENTIKIYGYNHNRKISAIKALRSISALLGAGKRSLGLKDAKDLIEQLPNREISVSFEAWQYEAVIAICEKGQLITKNPGLAPIFLAHWMGDVRPAVPAPLAPWEQELLGESNPPPPVF